VVDLFPFSVLVFSCATNFGDYRRVLIMQINQV